MDRSDTTVDGSDVVGVVLAHFGVKGMHWGVRKAVEAAEHNPHASMDHLLAGAHLERVKKHGVSNLSNEELRQLNDRMNLVSNHRRLMNENAGKSTTDKGHEHVKKILGIAKTGVDVYNTVKTVKKAVGEVKGG